MLFLYYCILKCMKTIITCAVVISKLMLTETIIKTKYRNQLDARNSIY